MPIPTWTQCPLERLDRVSFYVPPAVGLKLIEDVARKHVGEVWLNPGSESPELSARAEALGLTVIQALQHPRHRRAAGEVLSGPVL